MSKKHSFVEKRSYHVRRTLPANDVSAEYGSTKYSYSAGWLQGAGYSGRYYPEKGKSVSAFWLGYARGERAAKKYRG